MLYYLEPFCFVFGLEKTILNKHTLLNPNIQQGPRCLFETLQFMQSVLDTLTRGFAFLHMLDISLIAVDTLTRVGISSYHGGYAYKRVVCHLLQGGSYANMGWHIMFTYGGLLTKGMSYLLAQSVHRR